jgi:polysaccharide pyruvyl transferase WcaK-like protein/SAM-dependent methyltransferase
MKIVCIGFYGHGNAGDESIARSLDRYLVQPFHNVEMVFSTEMSPELAHRINSKDQFYSKRNIISVYDMETIKEPDVIIVGGGDLSATYGSTQVLNAMEANRAKLIARIGTSAKDDFVKGGAKAVDLVRASLNIFDYISVRDRASFDILGAMGISGHHLGADLAIDYPYERRSVELKKPYAVITVREVRSNDASRQIKIADTLLSAIKREIKDVYFLPFCKKDEDFIKEGPSRSDVKVIEGAWKTPSKLKAIIAEAEYVTSIGRLHPLVFSIGARVPCFAVTYPWLSGYDKINGTMHHAGLGHRVCDWGLPVGEIGAMVHDSVKQRKRDREPLMIYSGHLKGLMLESLCPVWEAMEAGHGLGLERGMKKGQFQVDDYDESYFYGARVYKAGNQFRVYHPTRSDWEGWGVVRDLIIQTMRPKTLIDVGCGRGWFIQRMIDAEVKAEGIDTSEAAWQDAAPGVQPYLKVGRLGDLEHRRYDVLTAFDVMEHIFDADLDEAISAMKQAAGRYIVLNICTAPDNEETHVLKKGAPIPSDKEWLAVSGHVTIKHRSWWKSRLEDENWEVDDEIYEKWFNHPGFKFPSWQHNNLVILKRRGAK